MTEKTGACDDADGRERAVGRFRVLPAEGRSGEPLEPGLGLRIGVGRIELQVKVRACRVAGLSDQPDRGTRRERRTRLDGRVEVRHVAVRPGLAVCGRDGRADTAVAVRLCPAANDGRVRERVDRCALGCRDVGGRIVVVGVRDTDGSGSASDREDVAPGVLRGSQEQSAGAGEGSGLRLVASRLQRVTRGGESLL